MRMIGAWLVGCIVTGSVIVPAVAEEMRFGAWRVTETKDRFGGQSDVIAATAASGSMLAVRCLRGELSIAVAHVVLFGQGRYDEGMRLTVRFRAGDGPVISSIALGLDDKMFQVGRSKSMVESMKGAAEYAMRVNYRGTTMDYVFKAGPNADKAIGRVLQACPLAGQKDIGPETAD